MPPPGWDPFLWEIQCIWEQQGWLAYWQERLELDFYQEDQYGFNWASVQYARHNNNCVQHVRRALELGQQAGYSFDQWWGDLVARWPARQEGG